MDGLIRRALLGDQQAQRKCTDEEIILPCPLCGSKASVQKDISGKERYHVVCSNVKNACNLVSGLPIWRGSAEEAIVEWNTRPASPIGRCKDCSWYLPISKRCRCGFSGLWGEVNELSFCSEFKPREGTEGER